MTLKFHTPARWFALVLALIATHASPLLAAEWGLDDLMAALAQTKAGRATFVEKKHIAALDKPLESSGELSFAAPGRLEKKTLKPKTELLLIENGNVTVERGKKKFEIALQDFPEMASFVEGIRGTLAGDLAALQRVYAITLTGSAAKWMLSLQPHDGKMASIVKQIRISGRNHDVLGVEVLQADGDRSHMVIEPMVAAQ